MTDVRALVRALVQELRDSDPTIAAAGECGSRALKRTGTELAPADKVWFEGGEGARRQG